MSLVQLIAHADERGLAASGLACLDRCVPLLGGDDEILRPLWTTLAHPADADAWASRLARVRGALAGPGEPGEGEAALLARRMLAAAPSEPSAAGLRVWADACSLAALRIHRLLDPAGEDTPGETGEAGEAGGAGETGGAGDAEVTGGGVRGGSPLVAAELRRQTAVLELLAEHGTGGLRRAHEVTTEGRRVLRAVVSRRARGRG
ncbi:hypothetical protein [Streptomyces griseoviridis]|uniref:hypothetical protein n=1 Tax=Streptomyces griseoviridis TaxID=45398 RepID=UPI0034566E0B